MKFLSSFKPALLNFNNLTKESLKLDLKAGIIVAIIASLPLSIAFGIASGVSPEKGLISAIIGGFVIACLGGSRVQISGPTGAFIIIISSITSQFGQNGLLIATVIAGIMLIFMGLFKLGAIIKFIPYPIVVGFTSAIAVSIFTSQIKDLFGLTMENPPVDFISRWMAYGKTISSTNFYSLVVGLLTIAIIIYLPKFSKKIPSSLFSIIFMSIIAFIMKKYLYINDIQTIGDKFHIDSSLPQANTIPITMETINLLLPAAFTIAMLCAIQSLLSATVADGITGQRHKSNTELIAQGIGNIIVPIFGGIPVTGGIARTLTNISYGGRSPVAAIVNSITLLLILLFLGPLTEYIPMACLSGVLIVISYNMCEWRTFKSMLKNPKADVIVLLVTFFLTLIFDLTIALEVGLLIAMLFFMKRMNESAQISVFRNELDISAGSETPETPEILTLPKGVEVYEIEGPFFFGIANKFDECMKQIGSVKPKVRIIRMRKVPFIDSTGLHNLESLCRLSSKEGIKIVLSGVNDNIKKMIENSGLDKKIGEENICSNINDAIERATILIS
ncbi:C4-dicarboxylic acid transporter [Bacteroidales bacterium]|nr:C4-dicarboxylic acid transporter [Bacteroidales bacterium]